MMAKVLARCMFAQNAGLHGFLWATARPNGPETQCEEIEARSTLRDGASFPPGLLNRNRFTSTQVSRDNPLKYHHDNSHILRKGDSATFLWPSAHSTEEVRPAVRKQKKEKEEMSHFDGF
jgi:hypothetical protein